MAMVRCLECICDVSFSVGVGFHVWECFLQSKTKHIPLESHFHLAEICVCVIKKVALIAKTSSIACLDSCPHSCPPILFYSCCAWDDKTEQRTYQWIEYNQANNTSAKYSLKILYAIRTSQHNDNTPSDMILNWNLAHFIRTAVGARD